MDLDESPEVNISKLIDLSIQNKNTCDSYAAEQ